MSYLNLDRARLQRISHRVGRAASFKYRFFLDGNPYPLTGLAFEWFLKKHKDLPDKVIRLTTADELVISGAEQNELIIPMPVANANKLVPHSYHMELMCTTREETWFNALYIAHNGLFDAGAEAEAIDVQLHLGEVVVDVTLALTLLDPASLTASQLEQLATALDPYNRVFDQTFDSTFN